MHWYICCCVRKTVLLHFYRVGFTCFCRIFFFFYKNLSQSKLIHCCISGDYLIDSMQRVSRPRGGINEWLHWLPISLHKKVDYFITQVFGYSQFQIVAPETSGKHKEDHSSFAVNSSYF